MPNAELHKKLIIPPYAKWGLGYLATLFCAVGLGYFWRAFFSYDRMPPASLTVLLCAAATLIYIAVFLVTFYIKDLNKRAAAAVFLAGLAFVFITPPLQVPDENVYFMRSYSVSQGHFTFDAERSYPNDVNNLLSHFSFAWVNAHNHNPITNTESVADALSDYKTQLEAGTVYPVTKEPVMFMLLPFIPQAIGILIARILGFAALGCMYAGRIANLVLYTILCYYAIKNCKRYKPVFIALALMPLSLFIGASNSYDSILLAASYFVISYFCKDEITDRDMLFFYMAFAYLCAVKANNLLFLVFPLCLPASSWKCKYKKWHAVLIALGAALLLMLCFEAYAQLFTQNYGVIERMLDDVNPMAQLMFVLSNIPRFIAIALGSLYENEFYIFNLGVLGTMDLVLPLVSGGSVLMLMFSASISVRDKSSLNVKSSVGLFAIALTYIASVLAAMYITYTPLYMARIIGVQPRYFLPAFLMLTILLAAMLSRIISIKRSSFAGAEHTGLCVCTAFSVLSALAMFQSYYIGPVAGQ